MDNDSVKATFIKYYLCQDLLNRIWSFLPLAFFHIGGSKALTDLEIKSWVKNTNEMAKILKLDQPRFKRLLKTHINALAAGRKPTKSLENLIRSHIEYIRSEIAKIPNTPNKARASLLALIRVKETANTDQIYDAMVLFSEEISPQLITEIVRSWKEEAKTHKEEHKGAPFITSDIFWVSRDLMEEIDGVSRYRFREHFGIGEFEQVFEQVEGGLVASILEGSIGIEISFWGDIRLTFASYNLWLASRSRKMSNRIRGFINITLMRIANQQHPEGYWVDYQLTEPTTRDSETPKRYLSNTYTTALCSLNLLKLSVLESRRQKGILGAKWLLENQNPDGSWSRELPSKDGITQKPDMFTSLLALEALVRSGLENIERSIDQGIKWIMCQQNELGMWEDREFPFPFLTVLVLEFMKFIKSKATFSSGLDPYLSTAKGFLDRSLQFSFEEGTNSNRLAIIAAFQAIEAFLYSVLSHPSVNGKIFLNRNETIGMRKALTQFQTHLQNAGEIKRGEVISYRNSLDRLAYLRDQIVHKAIGINQSECRSLVNDALKFVTKYSLMIHGFDIFA